MRFEVRITLLVVLGIAAVAGATGTVAAQNADACGFPYEAPNGEVIQEEPDTVAPGIASVSQTLWEMGVNENDEKEAVGLTSNSFYLEGSAGYDDLGTTLGGSYEENVIEKDPDVVVNALFDPMGLESSLDDAGIDYVFLPQSGGFEEIKTNVRVVGRTVGECEAAERVVEDMEDTISRVDRAVSAREEPVVMYGTPTSDPGQYDNFVPGNGTFKHDIITTAGGDNVYDRIGVEGGGPDGSQEVQISGEQAVLALNEDPDWIVITEGSSVPRNDLYNATTAVQENQILRVNPNYINQDAPRVTVPLERMARAFHPEAFDDGGSGGGSGGGSAGGGVGTPSEGDKGPFSARVSVVDGAARATFDEGPVETVQLGAQVEGDVTVESLDVEGAPGAPVMRVSVQVPEQARDKQGTIRASIGEASLNEAGVSRDDLVAVRRNGGWEAVNATFLDTETGVTAVIETPGFSEFAVVGSTEPVARADATLEDGSVVLSALDSSDEYGEVVGYTWEVDGETYEGATVEVETDADEASLTITNDAGLTNETTVGIPAEEDDNETDGERVSGTVDEGDGTDRGDGNADGETGADENNDTESDAEDTPGFTALLAVAALVAAAFVRR